MISGICWNFTWEKLLTGLPNQIELSPSQEIPQFLIFTKLFTSTTHNVLSWSTWIQSIPRSCFKSQCNIIFSSVLVFSMRAIRHIQINLLHFMSFRANVHFTNITKSEVIPGVLSFVQAIVSVYLEPLWLTMNYRESSVKQRCKFWVKIKPNVLKRLLFKMKK
jgi:hypothetical protein